MTPYHRKRIKIIDSYVDALTWDDATSLISDWGLHRESRYICICNVHSLVTAKDNPVFQNVINKADMATPDGYPVAWMLRRLGSPEQQRINGPDLMWELCRRGQGKLGIYLFGSTEKTLYLLKRSFNKHFPDLDIVGTYSPPFSDITDKEESNIINTINASGAHLIFVGLGCPKQELWMAQHKGEIKAVMLGVGAAFDYHAGTLKRAPVWMQRAGLEWLYRLTKEPKRLWKRYLTTNTVFMAYALVTMLRRAWKT